MDFSFFSLVAASSRRRECPLPSLRVFQMNNTHNFCKRKMPLVQHGTSSSISFCGGGGRRWSTTRANRRPTLTEVQSSLHTLNVSLDMDKLAWKQKYRQLVKKHHPDAGGNAQNMTAITVAYDTLLQLTPRETCEYATLLRQKSEGGEMGENQSMQQASAWGVENRYPPRWRASRGSAASPRHSTSYAYAFNNQSGEQTMGKKRRMRREGENVEEEVGERKKKSNGYDYSTIHRDFHYRRREGDFFWRSFAASFSHFSPSSGSGGTVKKTKRPISSIFSSFSPPTRDPYSSFVVFNYSFFLDKCRGIGRALRKTRKKEKGASCGPFSASRRDSTTISGGEEGERGRRSDEDEDGAPSRTRSPPSHGGDCCHHYYYFGMRPRQRAQFMAPARILLRAMLFLLFIFSLLLWVCRFVRDWNQEHFYMPAVSHVSRHERLSSIHDKVFYLPPSPSSWKKMTEEHDEEEKEQKKQSDTRGVTFLESQQSSSAASMNLAHSLHLFHIPFISLKKLIMNAVSPHATSTSYVSGIPYNNNRENIYNDSAYYHRVESRQVHTRKGGNEEETKKEERIKDDEERQRAEKERPMMSLEDTTAYELMKTVLKPPDESRKKFIPYAEEKIREEARGEGNHHWGGGGGGPSMSAANPSAVFTGARPPLPESLPNGNYFFSIGTGRRGIEEKEEEEHHPGDYYSNEKQGRRKKRMNGAEWWSSCDGVLRPLYPGYIQGIIKFSPFLASFS